MPDTPIAWAGRRLVGGCARLRRRGPCARRPPRRLRLRFLVEPGLAALLLVPAAPIASGATPDPGAQRRELVAKRTVWGHQHLRDYSFRLQLRCFCPPPKVATIVVRNGRPQGRVGVGFRSFDTIPKLFATVRLGLVGAEVGPAQVSYDAVRGFPRRASLDPIKNAIDDELGWTVDRFRPLPRR